MALHRYLRLANLERPGVSKTGMTNRPVNAPLANAG
jgi:hypothetical protein